jgi:hypothetical protein
MKTLFKILVPLFSMVAFAGLAFFVVAQWPHHPTDTKLMKTFAANERKLNALIRLYKRADKPMSVKNEMQHLLDQLGSATVIARSGGVEIAMSTASLANEGSYKGFFYANRPMPEGKKELGVHGNPTECGPDGSVFKHIKNNWYLVLSCL